MKKRTLHRSELEGAGADKSNWSKYNKLNWIIWFWREEENNVVASVFAGDCYIGALRYSPEKKEFSSYYKGACKLITSDEASAVRKLVSLFRKELGAKAFDYIEKKHGEKKAYR